MSDWRNGDVGEWKRLAKKHFNTAINKGYLHLKYRYNSRKPRFMRSKPSFYEPYDRCPKCGELKSKRYGLCRRCNARKRYMR